MPVKRTFISVLIAGALASSATAAAAGHPTINIKLEGTAADAASFKAAVTGTAVAGERLIFFADEQHCAATEANESGHKAIAAFAPFNGIQVHPTFSHTYSLDSAGPLFDDNYLCAYLVKPGKKGSAITPTVAVTVLRYKHQ